MGRQGGKPELQYWLESFDCLTRSLDSLVARRRANRRAPLYRTAFCDEGGAVERRLRPRFRVLPGDHKPSVQNATVKKGTHKDFVLLQALEDAPS